MYDDILYVVWVDSLSTCSFFGTTNGIYVYACGCERRIASQQWYMEDAARKLHRDISVFVNSLPDEQPELRAALTAAASQVADSFDVLPKENSGKIGSVRKMQVQRAYFKRKAEKLQKQLHQYSGKKSHGFLNRMWLVRVGLQDPTVPARSLEQFCREFHDVEVSTISATTIASSRDAFCELIKLQMGRVVADAIGQMSGSVENVSLPLVLCHLHDEAALRLRSFDASLGQRRIRSRSSKIQNNVLRMHIGRDAFEILTDLQPLLKKDGPSIAQALIDTVAEVLKHVEEATVKEQSEIRLLHVLTGDGVPTNLAAARFLLGHFQRLTALGGTKFVYFLIPHVCASHQANLAVSMAITICSPDSPDVLPANCSRLFKYLIPDYIEEFSAALRRYVEQNLSFLKGDPATCVPQAQQTRRQNLYDLYGDAVLPSEWLNFFNFDLGSLCHISADDRCLEDLRRTGFDLLHKYVMKIEEKPVVTRFFLFAPCIEGLLRLKLCQIPPEVFELSMTRPQERNQKRLTKFHAFLAAPSTEDRLKRACLCLQLTTHAVALTVTHAPSVPAGVETEPLLVRLAKGEVQQKTIAHLHRLLTLLPLDPDLAIADTVKALLATEAHLVLRFNRYAEYPTKILFMCERFNPEGFVREIEVFLMTDDSKLDAGYGLPLKREAWARGQLRDALHFMLSAQVQEELEQVFSHAQGISLDVERRHQAVKRSEKTKVISVSSASRNNIIQRYRLQRCRLLRQLESQRKIAKKQRHINARALAIKRRPDLVKRPRGKLRWEKNVSKAQASSIVQEGNSEQFTSFFEEHKDELEREAAQRRQSAKSILRKAEAKLLPITNKDWMEYIEKNEVLFHDMLKQATARRRVHNQRLRPNPEMCRPAKRLLPHTSVQSSDVWQKILLQQKPGWFCVLVNGTSKIVFFGCGLSGKTLVVELEAHPTQKRQFILPVRAFSSGIFKPADSLLSGAHCHVATVEIFALDVEFVTAMDNTDLVLRISGATGLQLRPRKRKDKKGNPLETASSQSEEDDEDSLKFPELSSASEAETVVSQVEAEELLEEDPTADVSDDDGGAAPNEPEAKAAPGTHIVESDTYFSLANYHMTGGHGDAKIILRNRWCCPPPVGMGSTHKSKTVQIALFDTDLRHPVRTYWVLRSWSLWRSRENNWVEQNSARKAWYNREFSKLQSEIQRLGAGAHSTGNAEADRLIRLWVPDLLG